MLRTIKKTLFLLSAKEKRNLIFLCIFMVFNALLEVFGIASVAPLIAVITNSNSLETIPFLNSIYKAYEFRDFQHFSIFLGGLALVIILVSNSMMLLTSYLSIRYAKNREHTIGKRLLETYLYQPYSFFLRRHSTELLRNVFNEVSYVVASVIMQLLTLFSKTVSTLSIILFLFIINPHVTIIIILILGGAYGIIYFFLKKTLYRLGKENVASHQDKLRSITDSIKAIRDIKMLRVENIFLYKFDKAARHFAMTKALSDFFSVAPRYVIELFAISSLICAVIYLSSTHSNVDEILPVLGIYAFAGYRLMPALQQIFNALSQIQFSTRSLEIVSGELQALQATALENMSYESKPLIWKESFGLVNVGFQYGDKSSVLHDMTLKVKKNQKIGIVGGSGAGKSTLIDLLVGLSVPTTGGFFVDGKLLAPSDYTGWSQNISYVSQNVYLLDDSIDINISLAFQDQDIDRVRVTQARKLALVDEFLDEMNENSSLITGENGIRLSGGQCQRIGIARALYQEREILVLDEATSALDHHTEERILRNIAKTHSRTLILITHRVETLQFCDIIYVLSEGKIVDSGSYEELEKKSKHFKRLIKTLIK